MGVQRARRFKRTRARGAPRPGGPGISPSAARRRREQHRGGSGRTGARNRSGRASGRQGHGGAVHRADRVLHRLGRRAGSDHADGGGLQAHLRHEHVPGVARAARVLRGVLPARPAGGLHQSALRLQDRHPHRSGAGGPRRVRVLPGEQDHDLRSVPRRPVRDGGGLLDPRDLGEPVRHLARLGEHRDPALEPRPGVQSGRHEHRRAARVHADPAQARRPRGRGVADARGVAHDPGRRARRCDGALPRALVPVDPHRGCHRKSEGAPDRRGVPRRRAARRGHGRAVRRAVAQQALPVRRRRAVRERGGAGVHLDVPDPVRGAGAGREPREGRRVPADQPAHLPRVALPDDLGDRADPRDQGARGARVHRRAAVPVRDVEPQPGRRDRRRLAVLLPVAHVPHDLRGRPEGPRPGDEVRRGRARDGDRRRRDHAGRPGQARGCDERGPLVHRPCRLLRGRGPLRAVRPQGESDRDRRRARSRRSSGTSAPFRAARRGPRMIPRHSAAAATAAAVVLALTLAACGNSPTSATKDTNRLEVVSWWTSGSEAAALDALFAAFRKSNADVQAVNGAVAGGAGSEAIVALAKRLQRGDPPDVWQTFTGKSVQGYARRGVVRDVAAVFEQEDLRARLNPTILGSLMRDGRPYGIPTGAHRSNVLWFNKKLLARAGVSPPSSGYTLAAFLADLKKVKASGAVPLCLGGKDRFTTAELFENTLLSSIGTRGWKDMVQDDLDWRSGQVKTALNRFGAMLAYTDPQANGLTWDQATKKLAAGGCAFESKNDSAFGELIAAHAHEGKDFGAAAFPGTDRSFLAVVDVFVAATKADNAKNALAFLGDISKPPTQLAFHESKGSIPVLRDVDVSSLTAYQRASSEVFWRAPVLLSVAHGEAMSPEFQEGFYDAVSTYVRTRSADAFADDLEDAVSKDKLPPR